jgi:hypothetical protein
MGRKDASLCPKKPLSDENIWDCRFFHILFCMSVKLGVSFWGQHSAWKQRAEEKSKSQKDGQNCIMGSIITCTLAQSWSVDGRDK